jgi:hypothetical protein
VNPYGEIAYFGHFKVVPTVLFGVIIELAINEFKKKKKKGSLNQRSIRFTKIMGPQDYCDLSMFV